MPEATRCWSCQGNIDPTDGFCRHCGMGQGDRLPWYFQPFWIAILALFAMGPLVLPLVWRTPKLSKRGKWIATALVGAVTWYMVYSFFKALQLLKAFVAGALP